MEQKCPSREGRQQRQAGTGKMTKAELQQRVDALGGLLFEAVHLLRVEDYSDEEREELVAEFLYRCQKEGIV